MVAAAGIPFLGAGYGGDPDAWLVASAAERLWSDGTYVVSRFPGYPLHEIVSAPLVGLGGCTLSNAGTLLAALALTALWYRISARAGKNPRLLFLSLVLSPLVLTNVATTMDYIWSLALLMAALDAALDRREIASGILTGFAAGFRPSNLTLALALATLVTLGGTPRAGLRYMLAAGASAAAAFLPVLVTYGGPLRWFALTRAEMGDVHPEIGTRVLEFGYRLVYAAGPLACIALICVVLAGSTRLREAVRGRDPLITASLVATAVMAVQFFALPLERSYLLPALPFVLLIADRCATPRMSLVLLVCIASMNLVNFDVAGHRRAGAAVAAGIREGRLQEAWEDRRAMMELQHTLHPEIR